MGRFLAQVAAGVAIYVIGSVAVREIYRRYPGK